MIKMYIQVRDLAIDIEQTIGDNLILTNIVPTFKYEDGIKTDDVIGYTYTVLLSANGYKQLRVKIPGSCQVDQNALQGSTPRVHFKNLQLIPYAMNGRTGVAAKAEEIEIIG